jgi:hypothetical protein
MFVDEEMGTNTSLSALYAWASKERGYLLGVAQLGSPTPPS